MEGSQIAAMYMEALARRYKFSLTEPIRNIPDDVVDKILYGTNGESLTIHMASGGGFVLKLGKLTIVDHL